MMFVKVVLILFVFAEVCTGVIYHLNETEYERMPPLFELDSNYRNCLMKPGGVYCVAKFKLHGDPRNELMNIITEYSQHQIKHYDHSVIDRAICVTDSCKNFIQDNTLNKITDLNMALERCINKTIWRKYGLEANLVHVLSCDKHGDQMPLDIGDWFLTGILILLLAMNVIGSMYDIWYAKILEKKNNITENQYLLSFSIFRNWEKLSNTNSDITYERLNGMHGLRSIATFFVVSAHVMWLVGTGYTDNPRDFELTHNRVYYQVIFSGMVIVQIFFVISGCLLTFYLQRLSETKPFTWCTALKILFMRWARLTPTYAILLLFSATWLRHLGSGPLWNVFVANVVKDCRTHWWKHLLHFNNYVTEDKFCAVHSWHLATEMQLFTIGLLVYMTTVSRRNLALVLVGLLGAIAPALHVWLQDLDALVMHKPEFYRVFENETFQFMHILGHNNVSCYAIGMAVGLIAYHSIKNKIEYPNNMFLKILCWCIPLGMVALFLSGMLFYVDGDRPHLVWRMAYATVQRPALGIMTAILLLNLVMKFENAIRSALEWPGWMFTSKLCYSVYLLHVTVINILQGGRTQLGHVSFFHVVINHFGVVSLTFAASIPFYLLLEAPLTSISKVLTEEASKAKQKKIS